MGTDMEGISTDHDHTTIPTMTEAAAVSEGAYHHSSIQQAAVAGTALWPMDTPITIHTMTHPLGIVAPHPTLTTSPTNITHATIPWTGDDLTSATLTTWHGEHS